MAVNSNSIRIRVSEPELAQIAKAGSAEDEVRFAPAAALRHRVDVKEGGPVEAQLQASLISVIVPKSAVERWLAPEQVAIEGRQAIGDGTHLRILLERDYTCLAPRSGEDDSELFANPQKASKPRS